MTEDDRIEALLNRALELIRQGRAAEAVPLLCGSPSTDEAGRANPLVGFRCWYDGMTTENQTVARARRTDRDGKSLVQAHLAKDLHRRLKHLAIDRETTVEALVEEAVEALLDRESADVERDHLIQTAARAALDGLADRRWGIDDFDQNAGIDPSEGIHTDETMAELAAREAACKAGRDWLRLKERRAIDALMYLVSTRGLTVGLYKRDGKIYGRYVAGFTADSNYMIETIQSDDRSGIRINFIRTALKLPDLHPSITESAEIDPW